MSEFKKKKCPFCSLIAFVVFVWRYREGVCVQSIPLTMQILSLSLCLVSTDKDKDKDTVPFSAALCACGCSLIRLLIQPKRLCCHFIETNQWLARFYNDLCVALTCLGLPCPGSPKSDIIYSFLFGLLTFYNVF